ncbi:Aminoacyl-tRNA synthetase, class 1a, anticodon-binding [Artemisia annua]|uniref:arginine--tRNA ligase n=1 Tax=Artemisia annua TaxID=35608 RepID=A0A2U1PSB5_ARTAN|nr:Aminoacyl-tRNA synthetase, class 1a, anticodon-binding [Artemisia annua]
MDTKTELFGEALRFELCNVYLIYDHIVEHHKLFGTIRVAAGETASGFSPDPLLQQNGFSDIFNREFNNPVDVTCVGYQYLYDVRYCSLPVSSTSTVEIAAKLYVTTDEVDDVDKYPEEDHQREVQNNHYEVVDDVDEEDFNRMCDLFSFCDDNDNDNKTSKHRQTSWHVKYLDNHEAFQVCDSHEFINFLDKPNGGWGRRSIIKGIDVDADLEVEFESPSEKSKVTGRVLAYYGKNFDYSSPPNDFDVVLSKTSTPDFVEPGKINLMRSVLAVPAQFSLILEAELYDYTSRVEILSGTYEFPVPRDGRSSVGRIKGKDCSLKVTVKWKLPFEKEKVPSSPPAPFSSNSSVGRLAPSILSERRKSGASSMADSDDDNRWSLQEEIEKVFNSSLERTFKDLKGAGGSCSISTCTKDVDNGDYLCSSVLHIWPQLRDTKYKGPKHAGLAVKDDIVGSEYKDMMERCVVCGPGFVKFKLSRKWIAKSIQMMLTHGIDTWAPKLSLKKTIIHFLSRNITEEMHMGHLRSTFIREALARMLDYSGVVVLQRGIRDGDHLEIKGKSSDDPIKKTLDLLREMDLATFSDGDETVLVEGRKLPLVYLTALWHALYTEKADGIMYVTDVEQGDYIGTCISAAKRAGWLTEDHSEYLLSHVGFGLVQFDDFKRFQTLSTQVDNLLNEAKSRCKVLLAGQDECTAEDLDHAAEVLGYGVVKYADLKNNRLANYTFDIDQALNKEGNTAVYIQFTHARICSIIRDSSKDIKKLKAEEFVLKNDDERELGLHLLQFTEVLREVCTILAPHILCEYLYILCVKFNNLNVCEVGGSSDETSRLFLCEAAEMVVRKCFDLLGIAPISKI